MSEQKKSITLCRTCFDATRDATKDEASSILMVTLDDHEQDVREAKADAYRHCAEEAKRWASESRTKRKGRPMLDQESLRVAENEVSAFGDWCDAQAKKVENGLE